MALKNFSLSHSHSNLSEGKEMNAELSVRDSIMEEWKSDDFSPASVPSSSSQPLSTRSNSDSRFSFFFPSVVYTFVSFCIRFV